MRYIKLKNKINNFLKNYSYRFWDSEKVRHIFMLVYMLGSYILLPFVFFADLGQFDIYDSLLFLIILFICIPICNRLFIMSLFYKLHYLFIYLFILVFLLSFSLDGIDDFISPYIIHAVCFSYYVLCVGFQVLILFDNINYNIYVVSSVVWLILIMFLLNYFCVTPITSP